MKEKIIIDATNAVLGRLMSYIAKQSLLGKEIVILNTEKAVIIGNEQNVIQKYKQRTRRGSVSKGPFFPSTPERIAKRAVRGMLEYKKARGREAFKKIKFYNSIPKEFEKSEKIKFEKKKSIKKFISLERLSKFI